MLWEARKETAKDSPEREAVNEQICLVDLLASIFNRLPDDIEVSQVNPDIKLSQVPVEAHEDGCECERCTDPVRKELEKRGVRVGLIQPIVMTIPVTKKDLLEAVKHRLKGFGRRIKGE